MSTLIIFLALFLSLFFTILFLASEKRQKVIIDKLERYGVFGLLTYIGFFALFGTVIIHAVWIRKGESSLSPLKAYQMGASSDGILYGIFEFFVSIVFLLWAFFIPAHLYANNIKQKTGARPFYPYVINVLVGIIVSTKNL
jgi:hypothetical protein